MDKMHNDLETLRLNVVNNNIGESKSTNEEEKIHLTKREGEILYLRSVGKNAKQIGMRLGISTDTVNSYFNKHLYKKFKVGDQNSLVEKAKHLNLIPFLHESFMESK